MITLLKIGRLFFALGIIAYGIQQIVIKDFRPQILPGFPAWAHDYPVFAIITGLIMIITGIVISGIYPMKDAFKKNVCFYLGAYFLTLLLCSQLPYLLFVYPHKLSHLGSWGDALKELAFLGGSWVMAGAFANSPMIRKRPGGLLLIVENLMPPGRIFFCITIVLFGCNHFVYDISTMVPTWFSMRQFWSHFGGAALVLAGVSIVFKIFLKPVALLLALMLFLWFLIVHVPHAIANPYAGRGNSIVSAFDALLFCGVALVLAVSRKQSINKSSGVHWANEAAAKYSTAM